LIVLITMASWMSVLFIIEAVSLALAIPVAIPAKTAKVSSANTVDGFVLMDLESNTTFTYAVAPTLYREAVALSFYDVDFKYKNCDQLEVRILSDGYVRQDYNLIAVFCDAKSVSEFTASSNRGFYVIVRMGDPVESGGMIKARFTAPGGTYITSLRLFGSG